MNIPENILVEKLNNVYFIWGRGKSTVANELKKKYGFFVYSTDDGKDTNWKYANTKYQPYMCRDFEQEYNVKSFWEIPAEVILMREGHIQEEVTPMIVLDLILLASQYPIIICEGDIDYSSIIPVSSHSIYLCNRGTKFDWFNRPDHQSITEILKSRTDLTESGKESVIKNAYAAVSQDEGQIPSWVIENKVKNISWYDNTSIQETVEEVAEYFGFETNK